MLKWFLSSTRCMYSKHVDILLPFFDSVEHARKGNTTNIYVHTLYESPFKIIVPSWWTSKQAKRCKEDDHIKNWKLTSSKGDRYQVHQSACKSRNHKNRTAADPLNGVGLKQDPLHATTRNNYINNLHRDGSPRKGLATATCAMCPADIGLQSYELSTVFLP